MTNNSIPQTPTPDRAQLSQLNPALYRRVLELMQSTGCTYEAAYAAVWAAIQEAQHAAS